MGLLINNSPQVKLSNFTTGEYVAGPILKVLIWTFINYYVFDSAFPWPYKFKEFLLRLFGAKVGKGLVIKPKIRIKYPWRLTIGDHCWLGESVWIDNLEQVDLGNNVCISQGATLLTGNHDYTISHFPYRLGKITVEDGVWIGAKAVVCPGVICHSHAVLTVNSVATKHLEAWGIYSGHPAVYVKPRIITQ